MNSTSYSNPITNGGDHGRVSSHINNNNIIDSKAEDEMTNQSMAHSMFEDADQSFDMSESGMMSFQDIKTELDMIPTPQTLHHGQQEQEQPSGQMNDQDRSRRHILPFPFRIPRPEKNVNVAIKEYVAPPQAPHSNKETRVPTPSIVDKDKGMPLFPSRVCMTRAKLLLCTIYHFFFFFFFPVMQSLFFT